MARRGRDGMAPPARTAGAACRKAASLTGPGQGAADHAVAAAAVADRQCRRAGRRSRRDDRQRPAAGGAAGAGGRGGGHRLLLRAGHRPGLGAFAQHGGQRPDGATRPRPRGLRRRCRAGTPCIGGVRDRGWGHFRLAGADDRDIRAGAGGRDTGAVGERRRGRGTVRLGHHRAFRAGGRRAVHRRGHQLCSRASLSGFRGLLRWARAVCDPHSERIVMNVELTDLTRRFGRTQAVAGVNLDAGPGVFGLLGPNGAGKTTLLRMMATVIPPNSGTLRLLGRDPASYGPRKEIRRRLGYMPPALVPAAVATAVERVSLGNKARAKLRTLSGGMLRRVGIAQAIVNEPELLLLDEPTAGLDPEQRVQFRALLRQFGQRATVIVSTHLVEDVGAACGEVALMNDGKIVFRGTPDELTARADGTAASGDAPLERGYSAVLAQARS